MNIFFQKTQLLKKVTTPLLFLSLLIAPVFVHAQTSDGSLESWATRRSQIDGYRQQSSELQGKINDLPDTASASVSIPVLFGVGRHNLTTNFGDPRDGGARTHAGLDIMAVKGTPMVTPTPAVVVRTGTGPSEGLYVYTANPGGETFVYMHLDKIGEGISTGDVLKQGDLIGYVGNTGNASGGAAHLHFEIHNDSGTPTDPYPRLLTEFPVAEKINLLEGILGQTSDDDALAEFLVRNFRTTFTAASNQNITLPTQITDALARIPAGSNPTSPSMLPEGDLTVGSSGALVVALQNHLIKANTGSAARLLASAGATGNFGSITKSALIEYQTQAGIKPADGYYGATTRAYMTAHPVSNTPVVTPTPSPVPPITGGSTLILSRNLTIGMTGDDVRALQKYLNAHGYTVSVSGTGSAGLESTYFGPATQAAVIKLQLARNISPAAGYVGAITRASLSTM